MSGIVGIIHLDGRPVERPLLEHMTGFMAYRGPDEQAVWLDGAVGFGHTMLRTTREAFYEHQPFTIDNQVWIVADARIDGREELVEQLKETEVKERFKLEKVPDVELILRAYLIWGENCVQHLIGDFSFAIWDNKRNHLFCARDQFGIKLFYYSLVGSTFIFSNTLNCIRQHPFVSNQLNEQAIGDFLLFDMNYNLETTFFSDIQRLPGAHTLTVSLENGLIQKQRYWTLPIPKPLHYRRDAEYIEHFKELMRQAVADRLRNENEKVSIFFSGGLDSTTIAATALAVSKRHNQPLNLKAFTTVYDRLIPDQERYYAGVAAQALGIPLHYQVADDYQLYEGWEEAKVQFPEPYHSPLAIIGLDQVRLAGEHSRVALYGQGSDESLRPSTVIESLKFYSPLSVLIGLKKSILDYHRRPPLGLGIMKRVKHWQQRGHKRDLRGYPTWLKEDFAMRLNLIERWKELNAPEPVPEPMPRLKAYQYLTAPLWSAIFEFNDAGTTGYPVEVRLPFLDLRLLSYLLSLTPLPWCIEKQLLREAMQGILPEEVRLRPKSPLAGDPVTAHLKEASSSTLAVLGGLSEASPYIESTAILKEITGSENQVWAAWQSLNPLSLAYWLRSQSNCIIDKQVSYSSL